MFDLVRYLVLKGINTCFFRYPFFQKVLEITDFYQLFMSIPGSVLEFLVSFRIFLLDIVFTESRSEVTQIQNESM